MSHWRTTIDHVPKRNTREIVHIVSGYRMREVAEALHEHAEWDWPKWPRDSRSTTNHGITIGNCRFNGSRDRPHT